MKAIPGDYPMVTMAEERKTHNEYQFDAKAIIIPMVSGSGHGKASINRIHYQEGKFAVGTILCAVIPKDHDVLEPLFLYHYCDVFKEELFVPLMRGMANVTLPMKALEELEIPLPSIDFQRKWLARFEHISGKQIALGEELTHQRALLTRLRQSILQDAVQGRLTAQWRQAVTNHEKCTSELHEKCTTG
ncbi:MAG TPA: restriction endonuclease subunit S, partial [Saprospiraceae bacterium]|nr:restriction endonuclease subunit S [Saprospiraceae bacterium]